MGSCGEAQAPVELGDVELLEGVIGQFVRQAQVVNGRRGFRFVVGYLSLLSTGYWLLEFLRIQSFSFSHTLLNLYFD